MRKVNVVYSGKDSILKIKDDSLILSLEDEIIKIPYSNIKDFNYNDEKEELTIVRYGGSEISIGMRKDDDLIDILESSKGKEYTVDEEDIVKTRSSDNSNLKTKSVLNDDIGSFNNMELEQTDVNSSYVVKSHGALFYIFLSFIPVIVFVCFFIFKSDKISGCYSIETLKICINGDKIVMSSDEDETTYYTNYIGKSVYIEDKYGRQLGYCERVRDSKNIYCVFNGIGSEFKKQ